ncbi:hypothetical protein K435DRAFT_807094 [Dendrothele bispora CBS 962.96]|uniref:Uncharacterized protein n=1 Tax=Dendrothele bispora (strain CBS 962.96) TaxID=1314807 RepID=A0A4S8L688_DENBC|nr:hypothetical protein K435DRAFT_807092 [Dendrothele bispora CBS 962.96]THU83971.1 hypothetical protein K435DRAFT_807094 [Dendrothele bispora CBS 962.96]
MSNRCYHYSYPLVTTNSSTPPSTQLEPGMMITREYVVDKEDLEAPASVIKAAIESDFELSEGKVDRTAVPKKARKVLGLQATVHPVLAAGWIILILQRRYKNKRVRVKNEFVSISGDTWGEGGMVETQ